MMTRQKMLAESLKPGRRRPREPASGETFSATESLLYLAILTGACLLAYANSFKGAFVFDDEGAIVAAENIRSLGDWQSWLLGNPRPVVTLSLAINYAISGLNPFSYHVVNVAGHILAAWTLFAIVRRTLRLPKFSDRVRSAAAKLALGVALLWALHPLQTEALTFVIQRAESLMGLFGLLMFYCVIRGAMGSRPIRWYAFSVVACILAAGCKVGLPTMPIVIFLYDFLFLTQSIKASLRKRGIVYAAQFLAFFLVLQFTQLGSSLFSTDPGYPVTVGFALRDHTWKAYFVTQFGVVLHYLQLALWPAQLCIDYEWPIAKHAADIMLPALPLLALAALTLWGLVRRHWAAFFGVWFFGLLAPSSSFMPVKDLAFEHRMYLPLAGVVAALVAGGYYLLCDRPAVWGGLVFCGLTLACGIRTFARNSDYETPAKLWRATVEVRPDNARAWTNYGEALAKLKKMDWAADAFRKAMSLDAHVPDVYYNLGNALQDMKQYPEAEAAYQKAVSLSPAYLQAHVMLGNLYQNMGELPKSEVAFRDAIAHQTRDSDKYTVAKAYYNLGNTLAQLKRVQEALVEYRLGVETAPKYDKAHYGLGWALEITGNERGALPEYIRAVELNPQSEARPRMLALAQKLGVQLPPSVSSPKR